MRFCGGQSPQSYAIHQAPTRPTRCFKAMFSVLQIGPTEIKCNTLFPITSICLFLPE